MSNSKLVTVENKSTVVSDAEFLAAIAAVQHQVSYHFKPYWNEGCLLRAGAKLDSWHLTVIDDADQAGALGYHDITSADVPEGWVFAKTSKDDGVTWSSVFSHEVLELIADPWVGAAWQIGASTFVALEVCDPVEAIGYLINGVEVSNFVLPKWFIKDTTAAKYDHLGHLKAPLTIEDGGYVSYWTPKTGWVQHQQRGAELVPSGSPARYRYKGHSRTEVRG